MISRSFTIVSDGLEPLFALASIPAPEFTFENDDNDEPRNDDGCFFFFFFGFVVDRVTMEMFDDMLWLTDKLGGERGVAWAAAAAASTASVVHCSHSANTASRWREK